MLEQLPPDSSQVYLSILKTDQQASTPHEPITLPPAQAWAKASWGLKKKIRRETVNVRKNRKSQIEKNLI